MNLLGLRPRVTKPHDAAQTECSSSCAGLEETQHVRRHLMKDFTKAIGAANLAQERTWMRFAVLEQGCDESLRDSFARCSRHVSSASLVSESDVPSMMEAIGTLVEDKLYVGVHLSELRDIHVTNPRWAYVIYELMVEPGYTLPSN